MADIYTPEKREANRKESERLSEASRQLLVDIELNKQRHAEYSRKMNQDGHYPYK